MSAAHDSLLVRRLRRFILAIQFLTRLPTPQLHDFKPEYLAQSARWFPLVGLIIGGLLLMVGWPAAQIDPWLSAWLMLMLWVLVTGGLHLDGLADLSDALGASHRDPARFWAVMKDPHLGSFGVLSLIMQLSGKLIMLMLLAKSGQWWGIVLAPIWARWGIYIWQQLPDIRQADPSSSLSEPFTWYRPRFALWVWLIALVAGSLWLSPICILALIPIGLYRIWLKKQLGGVSGDCLGTGVEITELTILILLVCSAALVISIG